ncbi:hypothetical protein Rsub_00382 [Raphidocelis subcapitata]|uniref:Uncharacterized protein n=1 Tax=Raphidocelis subcapitata TaxID=307507 RepID=A0A2V0NK65_9CHLO|nr:hypothetical protein Rsub_00382 [Raphidocelis subcapitata]|eukprot:GBF87671.1 hypothetical protein Rsub_00382 [Raphidocelis subcapitata]
MSESASGEAVRRRRARSSADNGSEGDRPPPAKRARVEAAAEAGEDGGSLSYTLYVRWFGPSAGQTKVTALPLRAVSGVDALPELGKELVQKAYPEPNSQPEFLASPDFFRFTPLRECLAVPGDIVRTELRLVITHGGWEYCVLKRALTPAPTRDGDMLVTAIEFEGRPEEAILGTLGFRVSLIAYPCVAVRRTFLDGVKERLLRDPASFQGIL